MRAGELARAIAVTSSVVLIVAAGAFAGDITRKDETGDVKNAAGLTKAEREAVDIVSVRAIGEEGLGVVVVATFKGNVEKLLGRGHLKNAALGMILHPKTTANTPSGLVTRGASPLAVLRKTKSTEVGVLRKGRTVTFVVIGNGYSNVRFVEVKSVPRLTGGRTLSATSEEPRSLTIQQWDTFLNGVFPLDRNRLTAEWFHGSCREDRAFQRLVSSVSGRQHLVGQDYLDDALAMISAHVSVCGEPPLPPPPVIPTCELTFTLFDPTEVSGTGSCRNLGGRRANAISVHLPSREVIAALCPNQLPTVGRPQPDTLECSGGSFGDTEVFNLNIRTVPGPTAGMTGEFYVTLLDGTKIGPFPTGGP